MEPRGTKTWIVDASACGQKGLTWRTNLGGAKFVTRPGGDEGKGQGFVPNGSRVRGVEEYRGWVKCSNGLWLPVTDAAGAAGDKASTEALPVVTKQRPTPVGRSGLGRDSTGKCIPYLHVEGECNCGGAWCSPTAQLLPEPAPAKFEYTWPAAPQKPATVVKPKPWWTWHHVAVGAVVAVLVLVLASQEESPEASYARRLRVPPLYRALEPFFRAEPSSHENASTSASSRDVHTKVPLSGGEDVHSGDLKEGGADAARAGSKGASSSWVSSVLAALQAIAAWSLTVPGKLRGLASMSREEWRAMLSRMWAAIKHEAHHFWVGTKLLYAELQISAHLVSQVMSGHALTRRERKQLTRTTADLFRLVPLLIIVIVPFMELALPVLLKLFPNMLPSTFQDKLKHEEALKAQLQARIKMAKFLQDTTEEMAKMLSRSRSGDVQATAAELYEFMRRVRSGAYVSNADIKRFAKLFNDEITLDSVDRVQLVNMAKFVNIPPYGTDTFLRFQLRAKLRDIKADDRLIAAEGVNTLTFEELRAACRSRGMRWDGETSASMRSQLEDWLDLSLGASLPSSLLILSRAFTITHRRLEDPEKAAVADLEATLASLPDGVVMRAELEACPPDDSPESKMRRLETLRHEQDRIAEEKMDLSDAQQALQLASTAALAATPDKALEEMRAATAQEAQPATAPPTATGPHALGVHAAAGAAEPVLTASGTPGEAIKADTVPPPPPLDAAEGVPRLEEVSAQELTAAALAERRRTARRLARALATLAGATPTVHERSEFAALLRKEVERYEAGDSAGDVGGASRLLSDRLSRLLSGLDKELDAVDQRIGRRLHRLDLNRDGLLDKSELAQFLASGLLKDTLAAAGDLRTLLGEDVFDADGNVKLADLVELASGEDDDDAANDDGLPPLSDEEKAARAALLESAKISKQQTV